MFERIFKPEPQRATNAGAARQTRRHDPQIKRSGERKLTTAEVLDILQKSRARLRQTALEEGLITQ